MCEYCEIININEISLKPFFENDALTCQYHYNYFIGDNCAEFYPMLLITPKNGITSYAFKGKSLGNIFGNNAIHCIMCGKQLETVRLYYPHKLQMLRCGITKINELKEKYKEFNR